MDMQLRANSCRSVQISGGKPQWRDRGWWFSPVHPGCRREDVGGMSISILAILLIGRIFICPWGWYMEEYEKLCFVHFLKGIQYD